MALRRAGRRALVAAMMLAFLAGCVDAVGFSRIGGLFVSFMSGNSTRLAIFVAQDHRGRAAEVLAIILAFVAGAGSGTAIGRTMRHRRQPAVLVVEAILLFLAAAVGRSDWEILSAALMAGAMGLENAVFASPEGETTINLTFMTGALVKIGEGVAIAFTGGPRWSWTPFLLLWLSLVSGAIVGSLGYARFQTDVLFIVSAATLFLAVGSVVHRRRTFARNAWSWRFR